MIYIGGNPYESEIIFVKNYEENEGKYRFLHKDYLGSILAISDEEGNKLEQRHYDAWGNLTHLQIGRGKVLTGDELEQGIAQMLIDRGYTSHEHLWEVGIIHMNGRLYDPLLRRFLNADEYIQDPHNTQNYNKYGYVYNNPLMYNDPSGEFIFTALATWLGSKFLAAAVIGAVVGVASYTIGLAVTGNMYQWKIGGALKSAFWGAVSGAVSFGLGEVFSAGSVVKALGDAKFIVQAAAHGVSQGVLSVMQGGDFIIGAAGGFFGSLGASAFGGIVGDWAKSMGGQVFFGALSGGIGAELSGGNFWQGAVTGGIVAGLNHAMHKLGNGDGKNPPKSMTKEEYEEHLIRSGYLSDGPVQMMGGPFDPLGIVEGVGMTIEGYLTDNVNSVFAKGVSFIVSAKIGGWKNNILTNTTTKGTTLMKISNKNFRIDLDIKHGLHYHRRGPKLPNGTTKSGQGISRHRPWEKKSTDKSFKDRF